MAYTAGHVSVRVVPDMRQFQRSVASVTNTLNKSTGAARQATGAVETGARRSTTALRGMAASVVANNTALSAMARRTQAANAAITSGVNRALNPLHRMRDGFVSAGAAASAFSGRAGTIGGHLRRATDTGVRGFQQLSNATAAARGRVVTFGNNARAAIGRMSGSVMTATEGLKSMVGTIAGIGAAVGIYAIGRAAFDSAKQVDQAKASLTGLYGSAEEATGMLGRLREIARGSSLDYSVWIQGAESLAYMGYSGDQAIKVLKNIETAMVATGKGGEEMNRVTEGMLGMINQGKVMAQELNQMSQAGLPIWSMLADHMGMSIEEVRQAVTDGMIEIDDVMTAVTEGGGESFSLMADAAAEGANTFSNTWARVKDNFIVSLGEMITPLLNEFTPALERIGQSSLDGLGNIPVVFDSIKDAFSGFGSTLNNLKEALQPFLSGFGEGFVGAFIVMGQILRDVIGPAVEWVTSLFSNMDGGTKSLLKTVGMAVGAIFAVGLSFSVASMAVGGLLAGLRMINTIFRVTQIVTLLARGAMLAFRGAVLLLNLAMRMNPIGLIITGIMLLIGAVIWAYNNIDWFREGVNAAFSGIMVAVQAVGDFFVWLWQDIIVPAWQAIVDAFNWAWHTVIKPIFDALWFAIRLVAAILFTVFVTPFILAWNAISAAFMWAWDTVISPVLGWIGDLFNWLWSNVLSNVFSWIAAGWHGLMVGIQWVYDNILKPCWDAVSASIMWLWNNVLSPYFGLIGWYWGLILEGIKWAWENILKPAWDAVSAAAQWLWNNILQPVFNFIGNAWGALLAGIQWAWENILKPTWNALQAAAQWLWNNVLKPVFDSIKAGWDALMAGMDWVYQNILKPMFDAMSNAVDAVGATFQRVADWIARAWDTIKEAAAAPIRFVVNTVINDGLLAGWNWIESKLGLDMHVDPIRLPFATGGEVPGERRLQSGGRVRGAGNRDSVPAMLMPGEYVLSKKVVKSWGMDNIHAAHQAARGNANVGPEGLLQKFAAGGRVEEAKRFAQSQHGKPYQWGGVGNPSYDCSGFTSAIHNVLVGRPPNSRRWTTHAFHGGRATDGYVPGLHGAWTIGVENGHMAGTLDGMNVESAGGGKGVNAGGSALGSSSFPWQFTLPQIGGEFVDGGAGGGGGWLSWALGSVIDFAFRTMIDPLFDLIPGGPPDWLEIPKRTAVSLKDKTYEWLMEWVGANNPGDGGAVAPGSGPAQDQVRGVARTFGWGEGPQWAAILDLVQRESSWNPNAANPTSSARGLFQKMTSVHGPVEGTAAEQAGWGLNYIRGRYGSPLGAIAHHNRMGWYAKGGPVTPALYDNGGVLPPTPGGYALYANHSGKPEAVLTNDQLQWLRSAADGERDGVTVNNHITTRVDASPESIAQANTRHARRSFRGVS